MRSFRIADLFSYFSLELSLSRDLRFFNDAAASAAVTSCLTG
jgi:hypothetical protein